MLTPPSVCCSFFSFLFLFCSRRWEFAKDIKEDLSNFDEDGPLLSTLQRERLLLDSTFFFFFRCLCCLSPCSACFLLCLPSFVGAWPVLIDEYVASQKK